MTDQTMRSPTFTHSYSQPGAYHFCQDSVIAPKLIAADLLRSKPIDSSLQAPLRALDVCAGCGVMGLELLHALAHTTGTANPAPFITQFDFLEIQPEFEPHFRKNQALTDTKTKLLPANYTSLKDAPFSDIYDLVIGNPPYFLKGEGSASANLLNTRARFFIDADIRQLLQGIRNTLKPGGRAYVLMKSGKEHGRDAFTSARLELFDCHVERLADVRGTDLIKIVKECL